MEFNYQNNIRDCFPACFTNAMLHFGIPVIPTLKKRLDVFRNGTENCLIYASEERLEQYGRSIHKFISEWNWAYRYKDSNESIDYKPEDWVKYLLGMGVVLDFKNGPIEQRNLIESALSNKSVVLCEIWLPVGKMSKMECKHFVSVIKLKNNRLLIHDPQLTDLEIHNAKVEYKRDECGSNIEIDSEYFFSNEVGPMKPKPNEFQTDWGYKFIIISKSA